MAYTDIHTTYKDAVFRGRCKVAIVEAALAMVGESATGLTGRKLDLRHQLAVSILNDADKHLERFSIAIAVGGVNITTASDDADMASAVASVFEKIAGIKGDE